MPPPAQDDRLAADNKRLIDVPLRFDLREQPEWLRAVVTALQDAGRAIDDAYWLQLDPRAAQWYDESANSPALRRLYSFGGPWNPLNENAPLQPGYGARPAGANLYPPDLDKVQLERYLVAHEDQRAALLDPYTVVRRDGDRLVAVPYHVAFAEPIQRAATALQRAADACADDALATWLRGRATALLNDRYEQNDGDWVRLERPPLEVIIGPHEVYQDALWGVKTAYQMAVGLVDQPTTERLHAYARLIGEMERQMPWDGAKSLPVRPLTARLVALHDLLRSGDALHSGYTFVATNLPNDPAIQKTVGTRKLFFMSAMQARVDAIIRPVASRLLDEEQLPFVSGESYLHGTALHEIAHALGPRSVRRGARELTINEALRERYGALEECKATVAGFTTLPLLVERGLISPELQRSIYITELAGIFRDVRLGEAHADASTIELNWHLEHGSVVALPNGRFRAVLEKFPDALESLARAIMTIQAAGDYAAAGQLIERYGHFTPEISAAVQRVADLPTEVLPVFEETR